MKKFIILIPLFNDWKSVSKLLNKIDFEISNWDLDVSVIIVNDASTEKRSELTSNFKKIKLIKILNMNKNQVHQRCIATGLKYIYENEDFDRVIVMDADGEDRPEELNDFLNLAKINPTKAITGNRFKRSEGVIFVVLYEIHKLLTFIFTGKLIKFGNFSCLTKDNVQQLLKKAYLWNSYSSSIVRTIDDRSSIPSIRGIRYVGPSKMNFFGLVFHSLAIISVFRKIVIIRSILFFLVYMFFTYSNILFSNMIPVFLLFIFISYILKISMRSNIKELNKSLENIGSIDILNSSNNR